MVEEIENLPEAEVEEHVGKFSKEVEAASEAFTNSLPEFKKILQKIKSKNSLARVFYAAAEFPLGKQYPKFTTEAEIELFLAFNDILEYKSLIVSTFMKDMLEKGENNVRDDKESEPGQQQD